MKEMSSDQGSEVTAGSVMKLAIDKLRIGRVMLSSDQVAESVVKSTSHKNVPPKEKHVKSMSPPRPSIGWICACVRTSLSRTGAARPMGGVQIQPSGTAARRTLTYSLNFLPQG